MRIIIELDNDSSIQPEIRQDAPQTANPGTNTMATGGSTNAIDAGPPKLSSSLQSLLQASAASTEQASQQNEGIPGGKAPALNN